MKLSDAIGATYDCVLDPGKWPNALGTIAALMGASFGLLCRANPFIGAIEHLAMWGGDPYWNRLLDDEWASQMPLLPFMERAPLLQPFTVAIASREMQLPNLLQHPFFTEWAAPANVGDSANVVLLRTDHRILILAMAMPTAGPLITQQVLDKLLPIVPHVQRALMLSDFIEQQNLTISTYERVLDLLETPLIALDGRGRVRHANLVASTMLQRGDGLAIKDGQVITAAVGNRPDLRHAIARAGELGTPFRLGVVPIELLSGEPAIAYVLPLAVRSNGGSGINGARVAIVVSTRNRITAPAETIASIYGLTDAESRVLAHIATGLNRAQTAAELNVSDSTIKSHLGHIFAKTGMTTQAELVQCVSQLSAPIRAD